MRSFRDFSSFVLHYCDSDPNAVDATKAHISPAFLVSERSAARLAHQSGGLGVPSSNLGAPTIKSNT